MVAANVRGLRDNSRRPLVLGLLRSTRADILLLSETNGVGLDEKELSVWSYALGPHWDAMWHGQVGIAWRRHLCEEPSRQLSRSAQVLHRDPGGRSLVIALDTRNWGRLVVGCVYGKLRHEPEHTRTSLFTALPWGELKRNHAILGGDWNCVLTAQDKLGGASFSLDRPSRKLCTLLRSADLRDAWLEDASASCSTAHRYTWSSTAKGHNRVYERLDRVYVSSTLLCGPFKARHLTQIRVSDHKPVFVRLQEPDVQIGPGFWRCNTSLLSPEVCALVDEVVQEARGWPSYHLDKVDWWDDLTLAIHWKLMAIAKGTAHERRLKEETARDALRQAEAALAEDPADEVAQRLLDEAQAALRDIEEYKLEGKRTRTRATWAVAGERPTKRFFDAVRHRQQRSFIRRLNDCASGRIGAILERVQAYYEKVFAKRNPPAGAWKRLFDRVRGVMRTLNKLQAAPLEEPISAQEILKAAKQMDPGRAPGWDGLSVILFRCCAELREALTEVWKASLQAGKLPVGMRLGLISLLPKKGDLGDLDNWRPITLMPVAYKVIAKALALRLTAGGGALLHATVGTSQRGFIPGRRIHDNLLEEMLVRRRLLKEGRSGAALFFDFKKAYDSVSLDFLFEVLHQLGFGEQFIRMVRTLVSHGLASVLVNRFCSAIFELGGGVRQGCPLSPILFALITEPLRAAIEVAKEAGIRIAEGVKFTNTLFADDLVGFAETTEGARSVREAVDLFCSAATMQLNESKLVAFCFGPNPPDTLQAGIRPLRPGEAERSLGIEVGPEVDALSSLKKAMRKAEDRALFWSHMGISRYGRAVLANHVLLGMLWYSASVLFVPEEIMEDARKLVRDFVNGRACFASRVRWEYLTWRKSRGGLGVLDPRWQIGALHAMLIVRFLCPPQEERNAVWRLLLAKEIWEEADKAGLSGSQSPFLHFRGPAVSFTSSCLRNFCLLPIRYIGPPLPYTRRLWNREANRFCLMAPKEPRDMIPPGDKFEFYDRKKKAWIPLEKLTTKQAYQALWEIQIKQKPEYDEDLIMGCVPPHPKNPHSPVAASFPTTPGQEKGRWEWLARIAVQPKVRQFLFQKWHGKLYLGSTKEKDATCRFLRVDGSPCGSKDSIWHFSRDCPTAKLALDYVAKCWTQEWGQSPKVAETAKGIDFNGNEACSLAFSLMSWCLWRARSISSCRDGNLVGAGSIVEGWKWWLRTTLEDMCRTKPYPLHTYALDGLWLKELNRKENSYKAVISFPPLSC